MESSRIGRRGLIALVIANLAIVVITGGAAIAALVNPALLLPAGSVTEATTFYAQLYAARGIPIALVLTVALLRRSRGWALPVLVIAGLSQAVDVAVVISHDNPGLAVGAAVAALVHLGSAWWWARI